MIHKVLKAYLAKREEKHLSIDQWEYIASILVFIAINIALVIIDIGANVKYIIELVATIAALVSFSFFEKRLNKMWRSDYVEYEKKLDVIRHILSYEMKYDNGNKPSNWYSEKKIDYLIEEGNNWILEQDERKKKSENFAHVAVLPVIAFLADILKDSFSSDEAIITGLVVLLIVFIGYCTDRFLSMIIDLIIKTASVDEMSLLINLLKDLKVRDFVDQLPDHSLDSNTIANSHEN